MKWDIIFCFKWFKIYIIILCVYFSYRFEICIYKKEDFGDLNMIWFLLLSSFFLLLFNFILFSYVLNFERLVKIVIGVLFGFVFKIINKYYNNL